MDADQSGSTLSLIQRALEMGLIGESEALRMISECPADFAVTERFRLAGIDVEEFLTSSALSGSEGEEDTSALSDTGARTIDSTNGEVLAGLPERYEIRGVIGAGGMGRVYLAFDHELKREVAVKIVLARRFRGTLGKMMLREREILARLDAPGIVSVFDSGQLQDGAPFFVMQLVRGPSLRSFAAVEQPDMHRKVQLVWQIAESLRGAHLLNIVHRDLKPDNIRIGELGQTMILDFGLSKFADGVPSDPSLEADALSYKTMVSGRVVGTPAYMSPEQAAGEAVGPATDVYSLGVILYELLTGRLPTDVSKSSKEHLGDFLKSNLPTPIARIARGVPRDLAAIVHQCLERSPEHRFADAGKLAEELHRFLNGRAVETYAAGRPLYRMVKFVRRNPLTATAATVAIGLLMATAMTSIFWFRAERDLRVVDRLRHAIELDRTATEEQQKAEKAAHEKYKKQHDTDRQRTLTFEAARYLDSGELSQADAALRPFVARAYTGNLAHRRGWEHDRMALEAQMDVHEQTILGRHEWEVLSALLSPDRKTLITSGCDGRVIAWDIGSGKQTVLQQGIWDSQRLVWRTAISRFRDEPEDTELPDAFTKLFWLEGGKRFAGISWKGRIVAWDLSAGAGLELAHHDAPLVAADSATDGRVLIADDHGSLLMLEGAALKAIALPERNTRGVTDIEFLAGPYWAIGYRDGSLEVFSTGTTDVVAHMHLTNPIWDLDFDTNGNWLAFADGTGRALLSEIDATSGRISPPRTFILPYRGDSVVKGSVHCLRLDGQHKRLLAGDDTGRLVAWSLMTGKTECVLSVSKKSRLSPDKLNRMPHVFRRRIADVEVVDADTVLVAASDTSVRRCDLNLDDHITTLQFSAGTRIAFDHDRPEWLWVADSQSLRLVDSRSGERVSVAVAISDPVTVIDVARDAHLVATCCGTTIRFWKQSGNEIREVRPPIQHTQKLRSISLRHDGSTIVGSDVGDNVVLWDVASGGKLGSVPLREPGDAQETLTGEVCFSPDGAKIAAAGPGQTVVILSGDDLRELGKPYVASGSGPMALCWDFGDPPRLFAIDDEGNVRAYPKILENINFSRASAGIGADVAFTPNGNRIVKLIRSGLVVIHDVRWLGEVYSFSSAHASDPGSQAISCHFDPAGQRLAIVHADGVVKIWETELPTKIVRLEQKPGNLWHHSTASLYDTGGRWGTRSEALALDADGDACLLSVRCDSDHSKSGDMVNLSLMYTQVSGSDVHSSIVDRFASEFHTWQGVARTVALGRVGNDLFGVYCRPRPELGEINREQILFRPESMPSHTLIGPPGNIGFEPTLLADTAGRPLVMHFAFDGYYLLATRERDGKWITETVGRQGDGRPSLSAWDTSGTIHVLTNSLRSSDSIGVMTYFKERLGAVYDPMSAIPGQRCQISTPVASWPLSITVDGDGDPAILARFRHARHNELVLIRRKDNQWRRQPLLSPANDTAASNLVATVDGRLHFAYREQTGSAGQLLLATIDDDLCISQPIGSFSSPSPGAGTRESCQLALRQTNDARLVLIGVRCNENAGRIDRFGQQ